MGSPGAALWRAIDPSSSQEGSPSDLIQLCSGKFTDSPAPPPWSLPQALPPRKTEDSGNSSQEVRELLGIQNRKLEPRMSQNTQMDDVIGLCSGLFPSSQTQPTSAYNASGHTPKASSHASSKASRAETSDGMSSDSSSEGEGGVVKRWVERQQHKLKSSGEVGISWSHGSDSEDDLPLLRKRKVTVKPTKG